VSIPTLFRLHRRSSRLNPDEVVLVAGAEFTTFTQLHHRPRERDLLRQRRIERIIEA
jgi:hypothetical protein